MAGELIALILIGFGGIPFTKAYAPYTRPTVWKPFPDGISLKVPPELGNKRLAATGLVDVTAEPFFADPTGKKESTAALQRAIDFARNAQMVCFFPPGTYLVSDTLSCIQDLYHRSNGMVSVGRMFPCLLVGSRRARRPRIVLAPNSPGFGDPEKPKYVVHFWARSTKSPAKPQPNISMNQMFAGIDITVGPGNPGAVAIRHRAAQGSGVQDCTIDATHGLTGLEGGAGSGGSHAGITIIGGKVGLDLRETQPAPTICGVTLVDQEEAAILYGGRQALSAVGLKIVSRAGGPIIHASAPAWAPHNGQICLVDSEIVFKEEAPADRVVISSERSVYLNDVYVKGAASIVASPDGAELSGNPNGWVRVREYAHAVPPKAWKGLRYQAPAYLDGVRQVGDAVSVAADEAPPEDLQSRHLWPEPFPNWESEGAANVKAAPYNARGDGEADDTSAIQRAIEENDAVFLPKGYYRVSRTIKLRPGTKLVGVGQHLSVLLVRAPEGDFADASTPKPVLQTADDRDAETVLAFCGVFVPYHVSGAYAVEWRAGRRSICRSVTFTRRHLYGFRRPPDHARPREARTAFVAVRGHGGGRWYNFYGESYLYQTADYRHLLVEGTTEPLRIYQCNVEHARSDANMEIRGARHVSLFGVKGEGNRPVLWVRDADHIRVFGYGGNAAAYEGTALFRVERTPNFLIANAVDSPRLAGQGSDRHFAGRGVDPALWHMISDAPTRGERVLVAPMDRPVLYRRGRSKSE